VRRALVAAVAAAGLACSSRHGATTTSEGIGERVATYRLVLEDERGATRHVRLLVWVARPDRLHAEIVLPVGGVRYTLDAGGGRACVVDAEERDAYAGEDGAVAVEALTGVSV